MKTILRIAKTELSTLFYSPIAWFLLIVFLFQCGLTYTASIEGILTTQELGGENLKSLQFLTEMVFGDSGLFFDVVDKLYLYIPLLTMGLISRETSSGTIKLLYSSPVKTRAIVFGKFLAMLLYSLILVMVVGIFAIAAAFNIRSVDYGLLLSGMLGLFLLLSAYSAIGLFMSSLTSYQVVAAISTLVMFAVLNNIGYIWQDIDFIRDLTFFLSIGGRAQHMLGGLITTKDILYFLIIVYLFLGATIYKLKAGRKSLLPLIKVGKYAVLIISAVLAGYVTSRPGLVGYWDTTATKINTVPVSAQHILKETGNEPLEITTYANLLDQQHFFFAMPVARNNDMAFWEPYLRFKPDIKFNYVYYYDSTYDAGIRNPSGKPMDKSYRGLSIREIAEQHAKSMKMDIHKFKTPAEIRKQINLVPELNRYVRQLKYKGNTTFLRIFDDSGVLPSATEISAALKRLLLANLPKIAFLDGQLERDINKMGDRDYKVLTSLVVFRQALINQGFDVATLSLEKQQIPSEIAALVIADPKNDFDTATLSKIMKYIADGGNLLIAGEPGKQSVLNPLLLPLGVQLRDGILVQQSKDYSPDMILPSLTNTVAGFSTPLAKDFADSLKIVMPGVTGLSYTDNSPFTITPLLMTNQQSTWLKKDKLVADSADIIFSAANGDERGSIPTALSLTRKINGKEQRIIVTGDADFMSNAGLQTRGMRTANFHFNIALFSWLSYGQFPIDSSRPPSKDNRINLTNAGLTALKIFFLGVLPTLGLIFGSVLLIRRKRK
ncbi:MAG TPA: Gldg family protein [Puia sp.]|nr:Gldg family protein [Puia sp.]